MILGNADQVFDDTLSNANFISSNTMLVLATHGYHEKVPNPIRAQYLALSEMKRARPQTFVVGFEKMAQVLAGMPISFGDPF